MSIISDIFMNSIEEITSEEKLISVPGSSAKVVYKVWNETIANLTLMALGSSAPEIMLSVIEATALKFTPADLGPSTIVGSAAFNLLIITGLCI